jgi:quercetin dioxygenase-like cupin family protein
MEKNMNPYEEIIINKTQVERIFSLDTPEEELVWHRDLEDRVVEILEPTDWKFQYDDDTPRNLSVGLMLYIPKGSYHRVIKGEELLKVRITKL